MFVQHSLHIESPIEELIFALLKDPRQWLPHIDSSGEAAVGSSVAGAWIRDKVTVSLGEPAKCGSWIEVPVTWRASSIQQMIPLMIGKVELAPVNADVTRLTVCGMYKLPLGKLGMELDDAFMQKVAEATVRELANAIAKPLESPTPRS